MAVAEDTGSFACEKTAEQVLGLAAHLVAVGLKMAAVRQNMDKQWSVTSMRLGGALMTQFRLERKNSIALKSVSLKDLAQHGAMKEDLEGFVEHMRRLRGVKVSALVREDSPLRTKISLRSTGPIDVRAMAALFEGGGHRNAAGATLRHGLEKSTELTLSAIETWLDENNC